MDDGVDFLFRVNTKTPSMKEREELGQAGEDEKR